MRTRRPAAPIGRALRLAWIVALIPLLGIGWPAGRGVGVEVARAAGGAVTISGPVRYDVRPAQHLVHVTALLSVANRYPETITTRSVVDGFRVALLPGARNVRAKQGSTALRAGTVGAGAGSTLVGVSLAKGLPSGASATVTLTFDLVDRGGAPSRTVRVGDTLVGFPVWAFGTQGTGGSSVTVRLPAGYRITVSSGRLGRAPAAADGSIVLTSGPLADPWALSAYVLADRPGAYVPTTVSVKVPGGPATFTLRAWKDDRGWATRTASLLRRALPALARAVGTDYPRSGRVAVEEATVRSLEGYGARYDPRAGSIHLAWSADPGAVLRAAAHLWADPAVFADRWIAEGLADRAAATAGAALKIRTGLPKYGSAMKSAAFPLNAWTATPGRGAAAARAEAYGQAASMELFRLLDRRLGPGGLPAVIEAARAAAAPVDWRGLLDLVEARGVDATDLWRTFVVRPADAGLLDDRAGARARYDALVKRAGDWPLPASIGAALAAWRFDVAGEAMSGTDAALDGRDRLAVIAAAAGLRPPAQLRDLFAGSGPEAMSKAVEGSRAVLDQVVAAGDASGHAESWLGRVGLLGQDPGARLAAARSAFEAGDLGTAQAQATEAWQAWTDAEEIGGFRARVALAGAMLLAVGIGWIIHRARHRPARRVVRGRRRR